MSIQYCNFSFLDLEELRGFFISVITCIIITSKHCLSICKFYTVELGFFSFILLLEAGSSSRKMD